MRVGSAPAATAFETSATPSSEAAPQAQTASTGPVDRMDESCESDPLGLEDPFFKAQKELAASIARRMQLDSQRLDRDLAERIRQQHVHA